MITHVAQAYTTTNTELSGPAAAIFFMTMLVFTVLAFVINAFLLGRIFKKANIPQWKAWIPVYNTWTLLEMGGQSGYWVLTGFAPLVASLALLVSPDPALAISLMLLAILISIVGSIFLLIAMYKISLGFGKSELFILWGVFLPLVWYIWLAFDDSTWQGASTAKTTHPPQDSTEDTNKR